ncbi:cysteine hydrolase family protein [Tardibacter chloracetimidivorans]|nr:cysteine hydrolase [Tardibacter chloracetimidivorans]
MTEAMQAAAHPNSTPDWAQARALFDFQQIDLARTALLVIDLQNGFIEPATSADAIIPRVNRLAKALRSVGGTVAYLRHTGSDDPALSVPAWQKDIPALARLDRRMRPERTEHRLDSRLDVQADDLIVDKYRYSAFIAGSSTLHDELRDRKIENVIITGAFTNFCCESSGRDALMLGYRVIFVSDATMARTPQEHQMGLTAMQLAFADVRNTESTAALIAKPR